jgi:predicted amidophosphoribosyltransferase
MVRARQGPRRCETCQAQMAPQDETCWRCGGGWVTHAAPRPDDGSSLRKRTAHVLDMRAHRRAASPQRDRH